MKPVEVQRLYGLFGHRVFRRCLYLLREEQRAMDITQDTWLALMDKLTGFAGDGQAASWLLTVATNRCLNELRRQRYWKSEELDEGDRAAPADPLAIAENRMLFSQLLVSQSADKASIVAGYFLEGMTMEEVAAESGYSLPTVRRTLAAFIDKAKARMAPAGQTGGGHA